jgi:hypothetical protein
LDEVSGKFAVTGVFIGTWFDDRLAWNPNDYNMTFTITIPQDKIWKPTIFLANIFDSMKSIGQDFISIRLYYNGLAIWTPPDVLTASCLVDVTYFPFDAQTCNLQFATFGTLPSEISLDSTSDKASTSYYTEHGTWSLEETRTRSYNFDAGSMFKVYITIKRRPVFFLVNIIFPVLFLTLLNSFVFLLPAESGERISYAITVLLAIAVFMTMISDYLPKTSQTMSRFCYFLVGDFMLSSIICLLTIFQQRIFFKSDKKYPVPDYLKKLVNMCRNQKRIIHVQPSQQAQDDAFEMKIKQEVAIGTTEVTHNHDVTWKEVAKVIDFINLYSTLIFQLVMVTVFFCVVT